MDTIQTNGNHPSALFIEPRKPKHKVIVDPSNTIPFEVTAKLREVYDKDEYKYLIHYARAYPDGMVPVMQYLLILFHPLIIKIGGYYAKVLRMEWRDLISFVRQKFIELVYRFKLESTLYFRMYIQTALRRAVYDRVLFESRRKALSNTVSLDTLPNSELTIPLDVDFNWTLQHEEEENDEDFNTAVKDILEFISTSEQLTDKDRKIYHLRFQVGRSIDQTAKELNESTFKVIERQRHIRKVVGVYAKENLT